MYHAGRISIIGAGTLGSTIAYSLLLFSQQAAIEEILLIDMSEKIVHGQVLDLSEATSHFELSNTVIRTGTLKEAGQSQLVIITADTLQQTTREAWMAASRHMMLAIASSMSPVHQNTLILVVSEPVDLFVQCLQNYFPHIDPNRIFGLGTTMTSQRFASWLKQQQQQDVIVTDAYCVGTREKPVVVWNHAKINGIAVSELPLVMSKRATLEQLVSDHRVTQFICERKGSVCYSVAAYVTRIVQDLMFSTEQRVWVLSVFVPHYHTTLSWPVTLGKSGIEELIDLPLTSEEQTSIAKAAASNMFDFESSQQYE